MLERWLERWVDKFMRYSALQWQDRHSREYFVLTAQVVLPLILVMGALAGLAVWIGR